MADHLLGEAAGLLALSRDQIVDFVRFPWIGIGPCRQHARIAATRPMPVARLDCCFSVNLEQQTFHCFKCGRPGNALEL